MNKRHLKILYIFFIFLLFALLSFSGYSLLKSLSKEGTAVLQKLEFTEIGERLYILFRLYNPDDTPHMYYYLAGTEDVENPDNFAKVEILPQGSFEFKRFFIPQNVTDTNIAVLIYEDEKKEPIENITYNFGELKD